MSHGLTAPLPLAERRLLREAVVAHIGSDRRTARPTLLHVGTPGGFTVTAPSSRWPRDFGTRMDLIHAMAHRAESEGVGTPDGVPWVWISRRGPHAVESVDLSLLGPAAHAYAEVGHPLTYFVVTRRGWLDPRSGAQRIWTRMRAA